MGSLALKRNVFFKRIFLLSLFFVMRGIVVFLTSIYWRKKSESENSPEIDPRRRATDAPQGRKEAEPGLAAAGASFAKRVLEIFWQS